MAILNNTFEGGADNANVTVAGSGGGSGDAFSTLVINNAAANAGGSAIQYESSAAISGTLGCRVVPAAANTYLRWDVATSAARYVQRKEFTHGANPSSDADIMTIRNGSAPLCSFTIHSDGDVSFRNGVSYVAASRSPNPMVIGRDYSAEIAITPNAGAGIIAINVVDLTDNSVHHTYTATGLTTGLGPVAQYRFVNLTSAILASFDCDNFRAGDLASGWIGPFANAAPTVDAGVNQNVSAGATVNLSATASDSDGSISAYAWSFLYPSSGAPSLTGGTTATPSFTAGSAGAMYILQCQVTDSGGATATDTVEVRVPVAGATTQRPLVGDGTGAAWTIGGGAATQGAALADETDTTYVESPTVSGVESAHRWRWQPTNPKSAGAFKLRLGTDTGTANVAVRLIEGSTTRQSWSQALTSSAAEYTFALDSGTIAAITDWGNLFLEVGATT